MDFYSHLNDHIKIWSLWLNKTGILTSCSCVSTTVWKHHLYFNKTLGGGELYMNSVCFFEQILEAVPYKTAVVQSLTSHLSNHPNKTNKTCWALLEKLEQIYKHYSLMDSYTWTHECWSTRRILHSSSLCRHWMPSRGPAKRDKLKGQIARECQGNPSHQYTLMMINLFQNHFKHPKIE